nr:MAG TPA: GENERAL CONTROL PROTEIN GCN4, NUCLEUS, DNA-BINDING, PROTEIN EXPORT.08A [Caudoviricetes sp.]
MTLEERVKELEEKQKQLEIELRRLTNRFDSYRIYEQDREDYFEILSDTHGYYDY